jgi:hypothetical protein
MVRLAGFEPATCCSGGNRSIHLSYRRTLIKFTGAWGAGQARPPGGIGTSWLFPDWPFAVTPAEAEVQSLDSRFRGNDDRYLVRVSVQDNSLALADS